MRRCPPLQIFGEERQMTFQTEDTHNQNIVRVSYPQKYFYFQSMVKQPKQKNRKRFTRTNNTTHTQTTTNEQKTPKFEERRQSLKRKNSTSDKNQLLNNGQKLKRFRSGNKTPESLHFSRSPAQSHQNSRKTLFNKTFHSRRNGNQELNNQVKQACHQLVPIEQNLLSSKSESSIQKKYQVKKNNKQNVPRRESEKFLIKNKSRDPHSSSVEKIIVNAKSDVNNIQLIKFEGELKLKQIEALKIMNEDFRKKLDQFHLMAMEKQKLLEKYSNNYQKLEEQNKSLSKKINSLISQHRQDTQQLFCLSQKLKQTEKQKEVALKQLKLFFDRKVPKNIRQLQSFREAYLQRQVEQLKQKLKKDKGEVIIEMQTVIIDLKKQLSASNQQIKNINIQYRILNQRMQEDKKCINKFICLKNQNKNLKLTLKQIKKECDQLKKENQILKFQFRSLIDTMKLNGLENNNSRKQRHLLRVPSESESLALSVSVESR